MARKCIFCGEEVSLFGGKKVTCGYDTEDVCPDCYDKYSGLEQKELAEKILATGRARNAYSIRDYLNKMIRDEEEAAEREKQKAEEYNRNHPETGKCPKCGETMHMYGPITIKLGEETLLFSDLNRYFSGSMTVRLARCGKCGYTEFYTPNEGELG